MYELGKVLKNGGSCRGGVGCVAVGLVIKGQGWDGL